jgi:hypothetical protein
MKRKKLIAVALLGLGFASSSIAQPTSYAENVSLCQELAHDVVIYARHRDAGKSYQAALTEMRDGNAKAHMSLGYRKISEDALRLVYNVHFATMGPERLQQEYQAACIKELTRRPSP